VLGIDERELAAIFTVQTAGEALNYHPHLHGLLADGYWRDGVFTRFAEVDLNAIEQAFAERVLAQLHKQELISDDDVAQILSQEHTGFGVWMGDPFHDKESEQFVARYIERAPLSLEKLSIQDDIVTYTTKDGAAHEFDALEFLAALSVHIPKTYESITRYYGRYSCRRRGERAKLSPPPEEETESHYRREFPKSGWAACIKRIYEIDPLECPKCKAHGNGRLSRVLTTLLLLQAGYGYAPYSSLESVIEANKEGYYLALRRTQGTLKQEEPDLEPWLLFFLRSLKKQASRLAEKIAREPQVEGLHPDALKILEAARRRGRITTGEAQELTGAPRPTVKTRLSELVKRGLLKPQRQGRGAWYGLP
jgi:uncharacterized membrane protein